MSNRREFVRTILLGAGVLAVFPRNLLAAANCKVSHPFMPPNRDFSGECHNCGMKRVMWARTWYSYSADGVRKEVCSIHCLAEASTNAAIVPKNVQVALYLQPKKNVLAEKAFYVVGSKARGTMTMKSKLAFPTRQEADEFVKECGGQVVDFSKAYVMASASVAQENNMIDKNRKAKGKIVEPRDNVDICPVCDMYSARYPKNKCQLQLASGKIIHFCSTQCLFDFLKNHGQYGVDQLKIKFAWVIDFATDKWIYARNAFYVVGSNASGPMGEEAFPFVNLSGAQSFAKKNSGKILRYDEVSLAAILN